MHASKSAHQGFYPVEEVLRLRARRAFRAGTGLNRGVRDAGEAGQELLRRAHLGREVRPAQELRGPALGVDLPPAFGALHDVDAGAVGGGVMKLVVDEGGHRLVAEVLD